MTDILEKNKVKWSEAKDSNATLQPEKADKKTLFDWASVILIPLVITLATIGFSAVQFDITNKRQDADDADKERETKEQVLTDFGKTMQELFVTRNPLLFNDSEGPKVNEAQTDLARGYIFIALRRLNVADQDGKADSGRLKGLLIRYLYQAELIGFADPQGNGEIIKPLVDLGGADLRWVDLEDFWMPGIGLSYAELREAKLVHAVLRNADLRGTDLTHANLNGADLRFANLTQADLTGAILSGACYVEGTEAEYFPPDFKPTAHGMKPISRDKSDSTNPDTFERCSTGSSSPTP